MTFKFTEEELEAFRQCDKLTAQELHARKQQEVVERSAPEPARTLAETNTQHRSDWEVWTKNFVWNVIDDVAKLFGKEVGLVHREIDEAFVAADKVLRGEIDVLKTALTELRIEVAFLKGAASRGAPDEPAKGAIIDLPRLPLKKVSG
jgi:hypothetical protein